MNNVNYKYPLTFLYISKNKINDNTGKIYVKSKSYMTNKYTTSHFYKPICGLL